MWAIWGLCWACAFANSPALFVAYLLLSYWALTDIVVQVWLHSRADRLFLMRGLFKDNVPRYVCKRVNQLDWHN